MAILVTGGAGYIGSHTVVELLNIGKDVVVVDNLSNSSEKSLERVKEITGRDVKFYKADILDRDALNEIFEKAQQNDSAAKQKIKDILDEKVKFLEKIGDINFDTNHNQRTFFGVGNNKYIISETHKINRFSVGQNGKVIMIVLEELN